MTFRRSVGPQVHTKTLGRLGGTLVINLSERTRHQVRALFAPSDVDLVERMLISQCGSNLPGLAAGGLDQLERIRSAAVRFSAGLVKGLAEAIRLAEVDWRDLLVAAGFAEDLTAHARWEPRPLTPNGLSDWLAGGSLPGVAFSHNDQVLVTMKPGEVRAGSVIRLEALEPEPRYLVLLDTGQDCLAFQRNLEKVD